MSRSENVQVSVPVQQGKVSRMRRPFFSNGGNGDVRIVHREYVAEVSQAGSTAFAATSYPVNPGMAVTFPWLSQIAGRYESYKFNKLKFAFETESPTSIPGSVLLAIDYDASDGTPMTKTQMMAYRDAVRSPAWSSCCMDASFEDLQKLKSHFVRTGAAVDIKLYDVGNLFVATSNATGMGGELYVEYDVQLMTPAFSDELQSSYFTTGAVGAATDPLIKTGNCPCSVVSAGTTTHTDTFTFTEPYAGVLSYFTIGTAITAVTLSGTGSVGGQKSVINAAGSDGNYVVNFSCNANQTLIITCANTTLTTRGCAIAPFARALGNYGT